MTQFLDLSGIRVRLEADLVGSGPVLQVGYAARLEELKKDVPMQLPSVWVVAGGFEVAADDDAGYDGMIVHRFGVLHIVRDVSPDLGDAAFTLLQEMQDQSFAALNLFRPGGDYSPCLLQKGGLWLVKERKYYYLHEYLTHKPKAI